jgi:hypothetical protein
MKSKIISKLKALCLRAIGGDAANAESDSLLPSEKTPLSSIDAYPKNPLEEVTWVKEKIDVRYQQICEHEGYPVVLSLYGVTLEELDNEDLIKLCKIFKYAAEQQHIHVHI